ncbi:hypothetical protein BDC45DRAFT_600700 [Circinella umbellata]|nr:hypothetical protein BDC45DRAFT_600700 [Circinella umbellata]
MTNPLDYLPIEILTVIADQLLLQDHSHCCNVNRQWYFFFRRYLYRSISLTTEKRLDTFLSYYDDRRIQHREVEPGQWVREIYCNDTILYSEYHNWQKKLHLFDICPSINTFHLILTDDRIQRQRQLKLWPSSLSHLTLDYPQLQQVMDDDDDSNDGDNDDDTDYYDEYYDQQDYYCQYTSPINIPSVSRQLQHSLLACLPSNLRSLTLDNIFRALRIDHLEMIHQACPTLTDLNLTVGFLCHHSLQNGHASYRRNYYDVSSFHQQQTSFLAHNNNNNNNNIKTDHSLLRHLSITTPRNYGYDAIMTSGWVQYLLLTYPNLDRLKLGHIKTVSPNNNNRNDKYKNNNHVVDDTSYDTVLTKYGILLDHLKSIQTALVHFISCLRSKILSRTSGMVLIPHDFQQQQRSISRSEIQDILFDAPIDIFDIRLKFDHPDHLRNQTSNIIQLDLVGNSKEQNDFPHTLDVDMLLTQLPFLRRLHAEAISLERGQRNQQIHPLREIKLKKSWVCDSALDSVTQQCPRLSQLVLLDCNILLMMRQKFQLSMPHHVMQSIVLEGVSLTDYFGEDNPIRLVHLFTRNELPRLFMVHRCNQQNQQLLEKNIDFMSSGHDYNSGSIIQCQSLDQLVIK